METAKTTQLLIPLAKSWGDANVAPIANAVHHGQRPTQETDEWAGETTAIGHVTVLDVYHRVMGDQAKDAVDVKPISHTDQGTVYEVSDGRVRLRIAQTRQGIARLIGSDVRKSLASHTPAPYVAWQALRNAGYTFKVIGRTARVDGCRVTVEGDTVTVSGEHEQRVMQKMTAAMNQMLTTEAWIGGHMTLGKPSMTAKPW